MALCPEQFGDLLAQRQADIGASDLQGSDGLIVQRDVLTVTVGRFDLKQEHGDVFLHQEALLFLLDPLFEFADAGFAHVIPHPGRRGWDVRRAIVCAWHASGGRPVFRAG